VECSTPVAAEFSLDSMLWFGANRGLSQLEENTASSDPMLNQHFYTTRTRDFPSDWKERMAPRHGFEPQLGECLSDQQGVDRPIFHISGIAEKVVYFYTTFTRVLAEEAVALTRFEPRRYSPTSIWRSPPKVVCAASLPEGVSPPQGSHTRIDVREAPLLSQEFPDTHGHLGSIHTANGGRGRACESLIRFRAHGHAAHPVLLLRSAGNSNRFVS
jgi:hypothetical protein